MLAILSWKLIIQAFVFLLLLYAWNAVGRYVENMRASESPGIPPDRRMQLLGGILQTLFLAAVMFLILIFVISGVVDNPTNFRYTDF